MVEDGVGNYVIKFTTTENKILGLLLLIFQSLNPVELPSTIYIYNATTVKLLIVWPKGKFIKYHGDVSPKLQTQVLSRNQSIRSVVCRNY